MTRNSRLLAMGLLGLALLGGLYTVRYFYYAKPRTATQFAEIIAKDEIENGDLIFQTSLSDQSMAIQLATRSEYSHCGLIYKTGKGILFLRQFNLSKEHH